MAKRDLKSIVEGIVDLPTLPQVVTILLDVIDDPDSSVQDVHRIMGRDPSLTTRVLKLVNSAFYALPNRISSITQAIVILGFNTVKSLAVSASVLDLFSPRNEDFSYEEFWAHNVGCAAVANALARRYGKADPDTAFVLGLTHDIGKLILDQYAAEELKSILAIAREQAIAFEDAEKELLATSAAEVGYWLAKKWKFPDDLSDAIRYQHRIAEAPNETVRNLVAICLLSVYVCRVKEYGHAGSYGKPMLPIEPWRMLGMSLDDLPPFMKTVDDELERATEFLTLLRA
ncbi:MAG: HDOD domain-containing protein [Planctomycetota bacterium]